MQTAGIDVGGIEYMIDDRDGTLVYYDINALSNFVADAVNVVGFDPFARLVDYLETRAGRRQGLKPLATFVDPSGVRPEPGPARRS